MMISFASNLVKAVQCRDFNIAIQELSYQQDRAQSDYTDGTGRWPGSLRVAKARYFQIQKA
jgi:hypothetical protein